MLLLRDLDWRWLAAGLDRVGRRLLPPEQMSHPGELRHGQRDHGKQQDGRRGNPFPPPALRLAAAMRGGHFSPPVSP